MSGRGGIEAEVEEVGEVSHFLPSSSWSPVSPCLMPCGLFSSLLVCLGALVSPSLLIRGQMALGRPWPGLCIWANWRCC